MKQNKIPVIGLTGGIGTGKSTVLSLLEKKYGAYIIQTDEVGHRLMQPGGRTYGQLIAEYGKGIVLPDGQIDRKKLGAIVFADEMKRERINAIVHPCVHEAILEEISCVRDSFSYIVIESALLKEGGLIPLCDKVWCVHTEYEIRINRLMENRGYTREYCMKIIAGQKSEEAYKQEADVILYNNAAKAEIERQIEVLLA